MQAYKHLASAYDYLMLDVDYDHWYSYLQNLLQKKGFNKGKLLDCACGTGGFSWRFSRDGWQVMGVDSSPAMLDIAWQKKKANYDLAFVQQDIRRLSLNRKFDVATCICDGFNYLLTPEDVKQALKRIGSHLKQGSILLFDISSSYKLKTILGNNVFTSSEEQYPYIWDNEWNEVNQTVTMYFTLFEQQAADTYTRFDEEHLQRAWQVDELRALLAQCGFTQIQAFEAFTQQPPQADSERIQFIATFNG